jgi:hypothetical protein
VHPVGSIDSLEPPDIGANTSLLSTPPGEDGIRELEYALFGVLDMVSPPASYLDVSKLAKYAPTIITMRAITPQSLSIFFHATMGSYRKRIQNS